MGRTQRALTSLVGAIPAGFLAYLLVMVFLNRFDKLSTVLIIVVGATLACAVLVTLMPVGLLVFGGKKAEKTADKESSSAIDKEEGSEEIAVTDDEEVEEADEEIEEVEEETGSSDFDIGESDSNIMSDSDDEISGSASSLDEIETADFEDEDEDEPPAKKKKKK